MGNVLDNLHPTLRLKAIQLLMLCEDKGLKVRITQGFRSFAEQDALYAQGRTKPGKVVTNARGGYSMHNWGVAFDFCRDDGQGVYNDTDGFFSKVGSVGKSIGLEWGGDWKSITDKPHFQLPDWGHTTDLLRSQYQNLENFKKTWPDLDTPQPREPGILMPETKFRIIKNTYLRTSPDKDGGKVSYSGLSTTMKKKCVNKGGFAQIVAGNKVVFGRKYTDPKGNRWKKTKSGYWLPVLYDGIRRAERL